MSRDEPAIIDGLICAETLQRYGFERQAGWCRNTDAHIKRLAQDYARLRGERDALYERLIQYEPPEPRHESTVRWTGD
jgi:hypothetical protein